jgi:hypothetical protein
MMLHTIVNVVAGVAKMILTATSELHASRTLENMAAQSDTPCFKTRREMLLYRTQQVTYN